MHNKVRRTLWNLDPCYVRSKAYLIMHTDLELYSGKNRFSLLRSSVICELREIKSFSREESCLSKGNNVVHSQIYWKYSPSDKQTRGFIGAKTTKCFYQMATSENAVIIPWLVDDRVAAPFWLTVVDDWPLHHIIWRKISFNSLNARL